MENIAFVQPLYNRFGEVEGHGVFRRDRDGNRARVVGFIAGQRVSVYDAYDLAKQFCDDVNAVTREAN